VNDRPLKGTGILQAMITMDAVALASLLAAAWAAGQSDPAARDPAARHVAWGLGAALLNLVARCTAIFYMLASGRAVKDLVADHGLDPGYVVRSKRIKRGVETIATLALVPVMVAAVNGGAVRPDGSGAGPHALWAWSAIAAAALCLAVDVRAGLRNYALLREVDAKVR
jgi:hypothetical protein